MFAARQQESEMGLPTKEKPANAEKGQGLSVSSVMKYLYKPFKKKTQEKLFCGVGTEMSQDLRGLYERRRMSKARTKVKQDEKIQKSGVRNLPHPHPNVRTTGAPSHTKTAAATAAANKKKPPRPSSASPTELAVAFAANHKKPPTLPREASSKPSSSKITASASANVMRPPTSVIQSAPTTSGHDALRSGTTSAAQSPETLYSAIHPNSGTRFMESSRDAVPISVSYANSFTYATYRYNSPPSPSITRIKSPLSATPQSGAKFVPSPVPSSSEATSPASYISRDDSPSVRSEYTPRTSPTVKPDAAHSATKKYRERRSTNWTDDPGQFYAKPESISPGRPFKALVGKNVSVRRSAGSNLTPESQSPVSLSRLSPSYMSMRSPKCTSSSTNPTESVRVKRQRHCTQNSTDNAEEEQQSGLSILRSSPPTGGHSNGSSFSPFMQSWPSEPDLLQFTSKPRSIPADDLRAAAVSKGARHEFGSYSSSPFPSPLSSTSGVGDVKVEQVSNPSPNLASLWALERKQTSSSRADGGSVSKWFAESFGTKSRLPRSRSSSNLTELGADVETAMPQITPRSSFRYPSIEFDRAKGFLKLSIKSRSSRSSRSSPPVPESSGGPLYEKTDRSRRVQRKDSTAGPQTKRNMSFPATSPGIAKLTSPTEFTKPKVALSRAASLNSIRSKIARKFSIVDGEVRDGPSTAESYGSRRKEAVTRDDRRKSFSLILDLLKSGRKSISKIFDSRNTGDVVGSNGKSPVESTVDHAEPPTKVLSVSDSPLDSPFPAENPRTIASPAENTAARVPDPGKKSRSGELARYQMPETTNNTSVVRGLKVGVSSDKLSTGHPTGLPPDLWQLVFCFLPRHQILGDLRIVCHEWQSAIDNSLFLPHMKQYQVLQTVQNKPSLARSATKIERWLSESQLTTVAGLLHHLRCNPFTTAPDKLASSLRSKYRAQDKDSVMLDCWRNCIGTLDALSGEFEGDSWCLALLLILFVCQAPILQYLLSIVLSGKTGVCRSEAVEFLYLILTAITASCWEDDRQPLLYELESAVGYAEFVDGQKSLKDGSFCFTAQQHEILNAQLLPDQIMVIKAFPGTGKTSTLLEYANRRRESKFAYIIFDRFVVAKGEIDFPPNTKCINFQKLAYAKVGWQYRHKLQSGDLSPVLVKAALDISSHSAVYFILLTLEQFLQSAEFTIKDCHIPEKAIISNSRAEVPYYLGKAEKLWRMMIDKGSREIPMTHQGYLKLYQLSESVPDNQFDCWLCDEAQNAPPVMVDIILKQKGRSKILAGDPHQQIHGFGDLADLIQKVKGDSGVMHFQLTYSFRFGREIAWTCNYLLELKGRKEALIGVRSIPKKHLSAIGNVHSDLSYAGKERGGKKRQVVFIAQFDAKVFEVALQCRRRKLGFVGGLHAYQFDLMRDTWHLMKGNRSRIQDSYIKSFSSYKHMIEVAEKTHDRQLLARIKVIDAHLDDLPRKIESVQAMDVGVDLTTAEVLFSTAHKAKGLEFDVVALTNDFVEISHVKSLGGKFFVDDDSLQEGKREVDPQEINLLYVAASRAKSRLLLNDDIEKYLRLQARGLRREPRTLLQHIKDSWSCASCQKPCTSCLAIVVWRSSDSENSSNNDPTSLDDSVLEDPSSSLDQFLERNQYRTNGFFRLCVCLQCARDLQRLPDHLDDFAGGVKMIASVFT